jgi:hypothetical protein
MPAVLLSCLLLGAAASTPALSAPAEPSTSEVTRGYMRALVAGLQGLQPYLASDAAFSAPANAEAIRGWLGTLATSAQGIEHTERAKNAAFAVSARVLETQVARTALAFDAGHPDDARWLVKQTMRACISCHSQQGSGDGHALLEIPERGVDDLTRADLLFATRQFDGALAVYRKVLLEFRWLPALATPRRQVDYGVALERYLMLRIRVVPDLQSLAVDLLELRSRDGLPEEVHARITAWLSAIGSRNLLPPFNPERASAGRLLAWAGKRCDIPLGTGKTTYDPNHTVSMLLATNALYTFLDRSREAPGVPRALVLVARCEAALGRNYMVPMSDLYLEECVRRVPHTAQARRCERELEAYLQRDDAVSRLPWNEPRLEELRALAAPPHRR